MNEDEITNLKIMICNLDLSVETKEKLYNQAHKIRNEIERLNRIIQIKQNRINKLNKKLIRRDNIIEDLKSILKSKGYEIYIPILERSDKNDR